MMVPMTATHYNFSYMGESISVRIVKRTATKIQIELLTGSNAGAIRTLTHRQADNSLIPA